MYLDPGIGSMLVLGLIGLLVSIPALLVVFRHRVASFFRRIRGKGGETS